MRIQSKPLREREKELQEMLASKEGRAELKTLERKCTLFSGRSKPRKKSVITFILVHERAQGLIQD